MDFNMIASTFKTLRLTPPSKLILLEAQTLSTVHYPPFPPDMPVLLTGVDSHDLALHVKKVLLAVYPKGHEVNIVEGQRPKVASNLQLSIFDPSLSSITRGGDIV